MFKSGNFQDFFAPPEGYHTEEILLFTYSLNLTMFDEVIRQSKIVNYDKDKQAQCFDDVSKKVACYVQSDRGAGDFYDKKDTRYAFQLYQRGCVHTISHEDIQPKSFHPKLWALLYKNEKEEYLLRLVISSRNLTKQNMLEGAIYLETNTFLKDCNKKHKDLIQMIKEVTGSLAPKNIIEKIEKADFSDCIKAILPENMTVIEYEIFTNSHQKDNGDIVGLQDCFPKEYSLFTGISPFLGDGSKVNEVLSQGRDNLIITRKKSYTQTVFNTLSNIAEIFYLSRSGQTESDEDAEIQFDADEIPLHAKIYGFDNDSTKISWIFIGSANFTEKGLGKDGNYELLLGVKVKNKETGLAKLLRDDFNNLVKITEASTNQDSDFSIGKVIEDPTKKDPEQIKAALETGLKALSAEREKTCNWETLNTIFKRSPKAEEQPVDYAVRGIREATESEVLKIINRAKNITTEDCSDSVKSIVNELCGLGNIIK